MCRGNLEDYRNVLFLTIRMVITIAVNTEEKWLTEEKHLFGILNDPLITILYNFFCSFKSILHTVKFWLQW